MAPRSGLVLLLPPSLARSSNPVYQSKHWRMLHRHILQKGFGKSAIAQLPRGFSSRLCHAYLCCACSCTSVSFSPSCAGRRVAMPDMRILHKSDYPTVAFKELTCFVPNNRDPFSSRPPHSSHIHTCGGLQRSINKCGAVQCVVVCRSQHFLEELSFQEHVCSSRVTNKLCIGHSRDESGWDAMVLKAIKTPTIRRR